VTAVTKIVPALPSEPFEKAIREVNEWRGRCLHLITSAELAVTECLETLSRVPGRSEKVRRRHLIGQRYEDLANALSIGGPFEAEGEKALQALNDFRKFDSVRTMLCHGASDITLDVEGRWTAVFTCLSFKAGNIHCEEQVVRYGEAEKRQKDLSRQAHRLCSLLRTLGASFEQASH
jgi:hypothetical protein